MTPSRLTRRTGLGFSPGNLARMADLLRRRILFEGRAGGFVPAGGLCEHSAPPFYSAPFGAGPRSASCVPSNDRSRAPEAARMPVFNVPSAWPGNDFDACESLRLRWEWSLDLIRCFFIPASRRNDVFLLKLDHRSFVSGLSRSRGMMNTPQLASHSSINREYGASCAVLGLRSPASLGEAGVGL